MPERLEELKVLLQNADRKDSGALLKAELIEQQSKMLAQIKQVNCYQVPFVQSDGEQRTAELYVYRRSGRRTAADGEEFSILIGLDTEYMGRVEALVKFRDKNVSLKFGLENQESLGAIIKNESKLAGAIRNMGFNLSEMDAHTLKRRTTVMNAHEVLVPDEPAAPSGIDVRI